MSRSRGKGTDFVHHFEGAQTLDGLLELAGSPCDTAEVLSRMRDGPRRGAAARHRHPHPLRGRAALCLPEVAQRLFQNLLGLWDLVEEGNPVRLEEEPRPPRPKKVKPRAPPALCPRRAGDRIRGGRLALPGGRREGAHPAAALLREPAGCAAGRLDDVGLTDEGYAVARHLLFELHAMLELGWPPGLPVWIRRCWRDQDTEAPPVPEALAAYAEEALFEAEQDEEARCPPRSPRGCARWCGAGWRRCGSARKGS